MRSADHLIESLLIEDWLKSFHTSKQDYLFLAKLSADPSVINIMPCINIMFPGLQTFNIVVCRSWNKLSVL